MPNVITVSSGSRQNTAFVISVGSDPKTMPLSIFTTDRRRLSSFEEVMSIIAALKSGLGSGSILYVTHAERIDKARTNNVLIMRLNSILMEKLVA